MAYIIEKCVSKNYNVTYNITTLQSDKQNVSFLEGFQIVERFVELIPSHFVSIYIENAFQGSKTSLLLFAYF